MKNLTLALLFFITVPAFAQKNELALSPGFVRYRTFNPQYQKIGYEHELTGSGYQVSLQYLRNIKWLQIGGGFEFGQLSNQHIENEGGVAATYTIANPFGACNALVNGRLAKKRWSFYAGASAGYMMRVSRSGYRLSPESNWIGNEKQIHGGFSKGGQLGASYQVRPNLAISADVMARFASFNIEEPKWHTGTYQPIIYDRLHMCNLAIGIRYKL